MTVAAEESAGKQRTPSKKKKKNPLHRRVPFPLLIYSSIIPQSKDGGGGMEDGGEMQDAVQGQPSVKLHRTTLCVQSPSFISSVGIPNSLSSDQFFFARPRA